jgi:ribose 5-phosphate isomerase B
MGERVLGPGLAEEIVKAWLEAEFSEEERHSRRVAKIRALEDR